MKLVTAGAEAKLVEELTAIKGQERQWDAVYFKFHKLLEHYRSDYQIKIATNLLVDLLKQQQGGMYLFKDTGLIILGNNIPRNLLDKAIFQLRYLFMDDPLAYTPDGQENSAFCDVYDLGEDYDTVSTMARRKMLQGRETNAPAKTASAPKLSSESSRSKHYCDASNLFAIEQAIQEMDIAPVIRRQPICATVPNMSVRKVFDELYLNISHLSDMLDSNVDLLSNRWLFKYLTTVMDERVLNTLHTQHKHFMSSPISINLNIRTLMSDAFLAFDATLKPSAKVSVVLEIQASDVFEDMYAFISARDTVQKLGYRICLDGLNHHSFAMIDRELLKADLVKLHWNANIKSDIYAEDNRAVAMAVQRCGANRIILTRCDNRQAVEYGQAFGISLFQGRYLDELIDPTAQSKN
jgi:EAL domain-containing protein (putative c-di-GMP-specific phosphodiesterase class I)